MNITHPEIDLGQLLHLRARNADQLAGIGERINADDAQAFEVGERMLAEESAAIETVVERFRLLCGDSLEVDRHVESFADALDGLRVTGDLYAWVDDYRERRRCDEVIAALPVLLDHLAERSDHFAASYNRTVLTFELEVAIRQFYGRAAGDAAVVAS